MRSIKVGMGSWCWVLPKDEIRSHEADPPTVTGPLGRLGHLQADQEVDGDVPGQVKEGGQVSDWDAFDAPPPDDSLFFNEG